MDYVVVLLDVIICGNMWLADTKMDRKSKKALNQTSSWMRENNNVSTQTLFQCNIFSRQEKRMYIYRLRSLIHFLEFWKSIRLKFRLEMVYTLVMQHKLFIKNSFSYFIKDFILITEVFMSQIWNDSNHPLLFGYFWKESYHNFFQNDFQKFHLDI